MWYLCLSVICLSSSLSSPVPYFTCLIAFDLLMNLTLSSVLASWLSWIVLVLGNCLDHPKVVFNGYFVGYLSWHCGSDMRLFNYYVCFFTVRSCRFPVSESRWWLSSCHFQLSDRAIAHHCVITSYERAIGQVGFSSNISYPQYTHPIDTPNQSTQSVHPINTPYQSILFAHPTNTPYQSSLSTNSLNTPYPPSFPSEHGLDFLKWG